MACAIAVRSVQTLKLAQAELDRIQQVHALDGAQLMAAAAVVRDGGSGPYAWTFTTDLGWVQAVAEPEADKVGLTDFAGVDDQLLRAIGVADPDALKAKVASIGAGDAALQLAELDGAPLWRDCGPSIVSPFGEQKAFVYRPRSAPVTGAKPPAWRIGETWRIQIATPAGWRDDRIVRFTGDARRPAAVVARRLGRAKGGGGECERLLSGGGGG